MATLFIYFSDHVSSEVNNLLKILRGKIKKVTQAAWNTLEVPDMSYWGSKLDMTHALTTYFGTSYFNTASFTDDAFEADTLVLTAVTLPVASWSEDLLAEETVFLRLESAVVDGLWLLYFAMRPGANVLSSSKTNAELIKEIDV